MKDVSRGARAFEAPAETYDQHGRYTPALAHGHVGVLPDRDRPVGGVLRVLDDEDRDALWTLVFRRLEAPDGQFALDARVWWVRGTVPGRQPI